MEEEGGDTILEEEEEFFPEEDTVAFPRMPWVEEKIKTQVSRLIIGLINQNFNVIL